MRRLDSIFSWLNSKEARETTSRANFAWLDGEDYSTKPARRNSFPPHAPENEHPAPGLRKDAFAESDHEAEVLLRQVEVDTVTAD